VQVCRQKASTRRGIKPLFGARLIVPTSREGYWNGKSSFARDGDSTHARDFLSLRSHPPARVRFVRAFPASVRTAPQRSTSPQFQEKDRSAGGGRIGALRKVPRVHPARPALGSRARRRLRAQAHLRPGAPQLQSSHLHAQSAQGEPAVVEPSDWALEDGEPFLDIADL
jgi:hypothetical protein